MQRQEWLLIALLTIIMLLKGVLWSLAFPMWQGPDEDDHYAVIQFIGELGRLPDEGDEFLPDEITLSRALADVGRLPYAPEQRQAFSQTALGPGETALIELPPENRVSFALGNVGKLMHATPLYYLLAAGVYRLFDGGDLLTRMQIQRLLVVILSSPLVILAYLTSRLLFPADAAMRLTIPTLVTFHPMISAITAVVTVDGFFFVLYSLLIYLSLRVLQDGLDARYGLAIGATFITGVLIKPTLNGFAPLIVLLVVYDFWRASVWQRRGAAGAIGAEEQGSRGENCQLSIVNCQLSIDNCRQRLLALLFMAGTILPPLAWWMQRSYRLNQDLFYFNPVLKGHRILANPYYDYAFWPHMADYYQSVWGGVFTTWWAHFGWLDTALPPWVYYLLRGLTFLALAGLVWRLARHGRALGDWRLWLRPWTPQSASTLLPWLFIALTLLLPVLLLQYYDLTFWWQYGNGRGLQGRYWLGTVIPMLIFFTVGLLTWLPLRLQPQAHTTLRAGMILLNAASLLGYILPRYYL
jgi:hypothetical protein